MPALWPGALMTAAILIVVPVWQAVFWAWFELGQDPPGAFWIRVAPLAPPIYWLYCVKKFHDAIWAVPGYTHTISPGRAVAFHFLPIYNLYWTFKWPVEITRFVDWRLQRPATRGWTPGVLVLGAYLITQTFGLVGLLALFAAGGYVSRQMRNAFQAPEVPEEAWQQSANGPLGL